MISHISFAQVRIVAHRGYWQKEGSAQNSLAALRYAGEAGVYGSEFDVCLTKDGVAVVNHDPSINGKIISNSTYNMLKNERLDNGEYIPTLESYLEEGAKWENLRLVMELKPQPTEEMENLLVDLAVAMVDSFQLATRVDYISFSQNICKRLAKKAPGSMIEYLASDLAPDEVKSWGVNGIDYHFIAFEKKPELIATAHRLGMLVNVWTVNSREKREELEKQGVDMITYDFSE